MDDLHLHDDTDRDIDDDLDSDVIDDESETPADTRDGEPKSASEEAAEKQEKSWLDKISSGDKTLEDMPENLGWLKKRVEARLKPENEEPKTDLSSAVRQALQEERAKEEFKYLVEDLKAQDLSDEDDSQLKEAFNELISDFSRPTHKQMLRALNFARKIVGIKDTSQVIKDRRRKSIELPPLGGLKRKPIKNDSLSETEKKLSANLPPGFHV